jgi:hypothetical protein
VRSVFSDEKISPTVVTPLHRAARARCAAAVRALLEAGPDFPDHGRKKGSGSIPQTGSSQNGVNSAILPHFCTSGCPPIASRTATAKIFTLGRTPQRRRLCVRLRTIGALREIYASCQVRPLRRRKRSIFQDFAVIFRADRQPACGVLRSDQGVHS